MPLSAHNDQYRSLYKYIRRGLPSIAHSEAFHQALTMINIYHLNKYNKLCSDSGIVPHQTAIQEHFLLDIIASNSLDALNGIANATATNQSGNWYRWGTLLKHTRIVHEFMGGGPTRAEETLVSSFAASVRQNQFGTTRKGILQKGDIRFYRKRRELSHDSGILHLADKVSPTFRT